VDCRVIGFRTVEFALLLVGKVSLETG
jgi:hypothetical protein